MERVGDDACIARRGRSVVRGRAAPARRVPLRLQGRWRAVDRPQWRIHGGRRVRWQVRVAQRAVDDERRQGADAGTVRGRADRGGAVDTFTEEASMKKVT